MFRYWVSPEVCRCSGIGSHLRCVDVQVEAVFIHLPDTATQTDVLGGLRTRWAKVQGLPPLPARVRARRLWQRSGQVRSGQGRAGQAISIVKKNTHTHTLAMFVFPNLLI